MHARRHNLMPGGLALLGLVVAMSFTQAQDAVSVPSTAPNAWERYDWLAPSEPTAGGEKIQATAAQDVHDPFTTVATGALYQEKYGATYSRQLADMLTLSCATNATVLSDDTQQLSNGQKVGLQIQPVELLTLRCDVHDAAVDGTLAGHSTTTTGAAISAESQLPLNHATLSVGANSDRSSADVPSGLMSETNAYDVQYKQPLGKLPVDAVLKGHYEGASTGGATPTSLPSLEQSLVWKPGDATTIQAGLRQQQYQEYPGVDHQLNEALFADWSQKVVDNVSWHSYAEVLNSRGLLDQAPASSIASGANGTAQATTPGSNAGVTSSLPISIEDQTLTFSTGPSFRLQQDISASVEYSNRWDKNPAPGSIGQEQRVSVSVKGTF
jgi:hypothetical protein